MPDKNATIYDAKAFGLTSSEFNSIKKLLGRIPNVFELEMLSILWSEHASYKNSLKWLELLPVNGEKVVVEAGGENAGAIDIGDGQVCVFKVESHNHPCAIQPRLGASTGLRVVNRDVFLMGAKPLAFLDSLRFGNGEKDTAKWLFGEVIKGLADFEKAFGVPVVGGEVYFYDEFNSTPVVNNMVVGTAKKESLTSAVAKGEGSLVAVIGASTGREGVDGDAFANDIITDNGTKSGMIDYLKNVEVEKSLYKVLQNLQKEKLLIGVNTVGGQGIVGAAVEMAARGKSGIKLNIDEVPLREQGLSVRDILVSETWGRMLVCFSPSDKDKVRSVAHKNGVEFGVVGQIVNNEVFTVTDNDKLIAEIPVKYMGMTGGEAPVYDPDYKIRSNRFKEYKTEDIPEPDHYPAVVKKMMTSLNVVSKKWLSKNFSRSLRLDDMGGKYPSDAAIIETGTKGKALLATMDCNPGYMSSDPYKGAQIAVSESVRNIICAGGSPLAISDCLNFGNPDDPEAYGDFVSSVKGVADACKRFKLPVISGNVSFYNQRSVEGKIEPITPSPVIGTVGLLNDSSRHTTLSFRHKGDMIFLVGRSQDDINGSEYIRQVCNIENSAAPFFDMEEEEKLHLIIKGLISNNLVRSVHDVSNGGLFFTLLECSAPLEFGFDITSDAEIRKDAFLFGESQSRVVVTVSSEKQDDFVDFMVDNSFSFSILGHVTKGEVRIDDESYGFIKSLKKSFENQLKQWFEHRR
ncbi:phosphoribosylformylglycinamidine synthase subunit PurL [Marinilabiliaceae bacterium ANBcel2]|nr:phosphoribosylformylglycinamidine synthase subunit PurL [Marinilabiliaceae bacterium ANBcel2]